MTYAGPDFDRILAEEEEIERRTRHFPVERIGYLCIQGYPNRICSGCTSACCEPVFAYPDPDIDGYDVQPAHDRYNNR